MIVARRQHELRGDRPRAPDCDRRLVRQHQAREHEAADADDGDADHVDERQPEHHAKLPLDAQ